MSRAEVEDLLGVPDRVEIDATHPSAAVRNLMGDIAGGPTQLVYGSASKVAVLLFYRDPSRPRRRYSIALQDGVVLSLTTETRSVEAGAWPE